MTDQIPDEDTVYYIWYRTITKEHFESVDRQANAFFKSKYPDLNEREIADMIENISHHYPLPISGKRQMTVLRYMYQSILLDQKIQRVNDQSLHGVPDDEIYPKMVKTVEGYYQGIVKDAARLPEYTPIVDLLYKGELHKLLTKYFTALDTRPNAKIRTCVNVTLAILKSVIVYNPNIPSQPENAPLQVFHDQNAPKELRGQLTLESNMLFKDTDALIKTKG